MNQGKTTFIHLNGVIVDIMKQGSRPREYSWIVITTTCRSFVFFFFRGGCKSILGDIAANVEVAGARAVVKIPNNGTVNKNNNKMV